MGSDYSLLIYSAKQIDLWSVHLIIHKLTNASAHVQRRSAPPIYGCPAFPNDVGSINKFYDSLGKITAVYGIWCNAL